MKAPTLDEIRQRWADGSPGPWHWDGYPDMMMLSRWEPGMGLTTVMDFARKGMSGAQPRFIDGNFMRNGSEMVEYEVTYRKDIVGVDHPDARKIAAAPVDIAALLAEVDRLNGLLATKLAEVPA